MKKRLTFIFWLAIVGQQLNGQVLSIGDNVPDLDISLITTDQETTSLNHLKGKVILLDFWATWCGSCIVNMPHLDALQNEFSEDLEVIAISEEERGRLERFAKNRPFSFTYAHSSDGKFQEAFPHRVIPHSVIIDKNGKVVAITNPKNIDRSIIQSVIDQEPIDLPIKSDQLEFDYTMDYFNRDSSEIEAFDIQPYNPDIPGFTKFHNEGRRITMHNTTITGMYREAFDMSYYRLLLLIDEAKVDWENTANRYNLDILVAPEDTERLREIFKNKLLSTLEIKGRIEQREMDVAVLSLNDSIPLRLEAAETEQRELKARGDQYKSNSSTLSDFADYLEKHGIVGMPVEDETALSNKFKFDFSFDPENSESFHNAIKKMGLKIKKRKREVDVLVIYEEKGD